MRGWKHSRDAKWHPWSVHYPAMPLRPGWLAGTVALLQVHGARFGAPVGLQDRSHAIGN